MPSFGTPGNTMKNTRLYQSLDKCGLLKKCFHIFKTTQRLDFSKINHFVPLRKVTAEKKTEMTFE
jgi:hypothetical protein